MSPATVGYIGLAVVLILMFLRMPIVFAFSIAGFCGLWYLKGLEAAFGAVATIPYAVTGLYLWSVMPMFIFMGYLAVQTKIAEEFYAGVRKWIGQFRGGLAISVILGNAGFGAVCGVPISAAATFSAISVPEMRKYGYADSLTLGSVAAGSLLSLLIPPSLGFIIFGGITMTSISKLFIAGILPGSLLGVLYIGTIYVLCRRNPTLGPAGPRTSWGEKMRAAPGMWIVIVVFVVMIGGLYLGLFTPTEAGAVGAFVVLLLGLARRGLSWQGFREAIISTGLTAGMIFFLVIGVNIFNLFLEMTRLPLVLAELISGVSQSPTINLLLIAAVYFVLGTFMDIVAVHLLTLPILFPVVVSLGSDPLTFGVMTTIMGSIGSVTPPFGVMVFTMGGIFKDVPMYRIFWGVAPFLIPLSICVLLVIFFPPLATWLPGTMQ